MDGRGKTEEPPLPPDYVSLVQLQERWLQKQQAEKLKAKQEEEKKEREAATHKQNQNQKWLKNDEMVGGSIRDVPRRKEGLKNDQNQKGLKIDGHEKKVGGSLIDGQENGAAIQDKGKGKEIAIGGFENEEGFKKKKKKLKKKKKKHFETKKSAVDGEIKECDGGDGNEGVQKIVLGNGDLKGIEQIERESMVEVLPRNGVRREIADGKRVDFRRGFRRNGDSNRVSGYKSKTEYRDSNELKENEVRLAVEKNVEGEKGYGKKWRERRINGRNLKESRADVSKGDEVEPVSENKAEDDSQICGFNGGNNTKEHRVEGEDLSDKRVPNEKKVDNEVLPWASAKNGEKRGVINGYRRYRNWSGRNNTKEHKVEGEDLSDKRVPNEKEVDNEVLLVESAKNGEKLEVGNGGIRRNGNWSGSNDRRFGGLPLNGWKAGNVRSMKVANVGYGGGYARFGRSEDRWGMKRRESGMMWVKKEADATELGPS